MSASPSPAAATSRATAIRPGLVAALSLLLASSSAALPLTAGAAGRVVLLELKGVINPPAAEYVVTELERAARGAAGLVVLRLDTPGGLDTSMREIVQGILNARLPVAVWVAPGGGRAASAGVFITMAAHVAAMAPGTNIGAAHPVAIGGGNGGGITGAKVENDAAAYLRSIAESRGRNVSWAEKAVRESVSLTEGEAVAQRVVDFVAADLPALLAALDGRQVVTAGGPATIDTRGATVEERPMDTRRRILQILATPDWAYLLMMLGIFGLFFELSHPGVVLPGVAGAFSLILGLYGLHTLPVNWAGLALIVLAVVLFIAEVKVVSYGFLTIGGIVSMVLGSLMLIDTPVPAMRVSLPLILGAVLTALLIFLILAGAALRALRRRPATGIEGLRGERGTAVTDLAPSGRIFVHGELWDAVCPAGAVKGQQVRITGAEGLRLEVEPLAKEDRPCSPASS